MTNKLLGRLIVDSLDLVNPSSNLTASGITSFVSVSSNSVGFGAALFISSDGSYKEAGASSLVSMPCSALALEAGVGVKKVLLWGLVRDDSWSWSIGGVVYVDTTTGIISQSEPSGSGEVVQPVGIAVSATTLLFKPDSTVIVLS